MLVCLLVASAPTFAASRGHYGGILRVALAGQVPESDPLLADTPSDATMLQLAERSICRLDRAGRVVPLLALEIGRSAPGEIRITLRPGLRTSGESPLRAADLARSWMRLTQSGTASPYRALLFPFRGEGRNLAGAVTSQYSLEAALAFPWPDLERSLCHPALAVAVPNPRGALAGSGPFLPTHALGVFIANPQTPEGRPYFDRLSVTGTDEHGAAKAFALKQVDLALGATDEAESAPPLLYATYLAFQPARVGAAFRQNFESSIDRADLTRFFVRGPAVPMSRLLPPALMPNDAPARPAPVLGESRDLTLLYDVAVPDQKGVAERIQVRLHDLGYRVALKATSRQVLRARWASGDFDAMLTGLMLPPIPGPALAIALEAAGRHDFLGAELPALGAIADPTARDAKVRERAAALGPSVPLIPLYAQGLAVQASPRLTHLSVDAEGLPALDDAFFGE